jgi:hypothetical protein
MLRAHDSNAEDDATLELLWQRLAREQIEVESAAWPADTIAPSATTKSATNRRRPAFSPQIAVANVGTLADELAVLWWVRRNAGSR